MNSIQDRTILYAEDEPTDVFFVRWALKEAGLPHKVCHVGDGQEAINYFLGESPYNDRTANPMPDLVLLDLRMPRMNGFDVLAWLREHPEAGAFPIVVLSSSAHDDDRRRGREFGATDYLVKPNNLKDLVRIIADLSARFLDGAPPTL